MCWKGGICPYRRGRVRSRVYLALKGPEFVIARGMGRGKDAHVHPRAGHMPNVKVLTARPSHPSPQAFLGRSSRVWSTPGSGRRTRLA